MLNTESPVNDEKIIHIEPHQMGYRWVMLALACFLYFCFGVVASSIAPLITPIISDLDISYSQMGIILGAWQLTYIIVAFGGGNIVDRWGIRRSLFLGIFVISLSAGLRSFANGFAFMFLCVALFGLGGPMISIGAPKTIATWFAGKERGVAVGIYMAGSALGILFSFSLTNSVIMPLFEYNWRSVFILYGLMAFTAAIIWWFLARDTRIDEDKTGQGIIKVFTSIIKVRNVQLVLMIGFLSMVVSHGLTTWLPKILETGGLTPKMAGFSASIPVATGIPAFLTIPRLTPAHLRGRISALFTLLGAGVLLLVAMSSGWVLISGLILYGFLFRCIMPLLMLVLMDLPEVGSRNMGAAGGIYFCISEIGGFAGPSFIGALVDITGEFVAGIMVLSVLSVIMSIMAILIKTPPVIEK